MTPEQIQAGFDALNPWHTKFVIGGRTYGGGDFLPAGDLEAEFFEVFPEADGGVVIEPGCCEGGRTVHLAKRAKVVVAVEGRPENLRRARFVVHEVLGHTHVHFIEHDLETVGIPGEGDTPPDDDPEGRADAVFASGVLYHMADPLRLLRAFAKASDRLFLWTHVCEDRRADLTLNGIPGWHGLQWATGGEVAAALVAQGEVVVSEARPDRGAR